MTASVRANAVLSELNLRTQEFFIGGSGPMALRDMRELGDLDIGVTTEYWFELMHTNAWEVYTPPTHAVHERCDPPYLYRSVRGVDVHVFFAWRLREHQPAIDSDYNEIFKKHIERLWRDHFTRAWPCIHLELLLKLKSQEQRVKDYPDIAQIATYIAEGQV